MVTQLPTLLLVIDGLLPTVNAAAGERDYRRFIHELQTLASMTDCTILLLASGSSPNRFRPAIFALIIRHLCQGPIR